MTARETDAGWMQRCEDLAREAEMAGNTPVGAVVVVDGAAAGEAAEEAPRGPRAFAHAELLAVEAAIRTTGNPQLAGA
ncbi:MAG TPA: deaminase, partial [Casimicrobiaceae bacterium]